MLFIGIDCGTQSLKALAWDPATGGVVSVSRQYDLIPGLPSGHKEQNPSDWIDALESCIESLRSKTDFDKVAGIGVSGQQHGLVALDATDQVVRPAKLWCDTSTTQQCDEIINAAGGPASYMEETGNLLPPGFTASKIRWMKQNDPESYQKVRSLLLPHDYLNFYLTGEKVAEAGDASGTGYFRVRSREWSKRAFSWIDPDRDLERYVPPLITSDQPAGMLRSSLSRRWGMRSDVVVSSGGGDNMMGAIGSGNVKAGTVTVSLGTSGTIFSYAESPVIDPQGEIAAFCDSTGGWLPLACTMNVTVATELARSGFLKTDHVGFEKAISSVPAGCKGLVLVPYLEGERLPNVPEGTGVLLGLRGATGSPDYLARAAMEGATLGLRYGLDRMAEIGVQVEEIRLIGGGAKSQTWRQVAADIFGFPVVCPKLEEGPAIGAAIQAYWCKQGGDVKELVSSSFEIDESTRCEPQDSNLDTYEKLYELYSELSSTLIKSSVFSSHRRLI